jgi:LysR family glycine cleavage system transcriptional activator
MRRHIPSLSALQAFEAAARCLSFTRAARELNITQSAVSRHVRALEEQLGLPLFRRYRKRISLTEAGEAFLPEIHSSLERIESSARQLMTYRRGAGVLNLATLPTFGTKWLVPRLPDFFRRHPGIRINFVIKTEPFEFSTSDIDAAIYFGSPVWPNISAERLIGEVLVPVTAAPRRDIEDTSIKPTELARETLLHLTPLPHAWEAWFEAAGITHLSPRRSMRFEHFSMCIEAAIAGLGTALVPHFLVVEDIRAGRLRLAAPRAVKTEMAYFFIYPKSRRSPRSMEAFRDWLVPIARDSEAECLSLLSRDIEPSQ